MLPKTVATRLHDRTQDDTCRAATEVGSSYVWSHGRRGLVVDRDHQAAKRGPLQNAIAIRLKYWNAAVGLAKSCRGDEAPPALAWPCDDSGSDARGTATGRTSAASSLSLPENCANAPSSPKPRAISYSDPLLVRPSRFAKCHQYSSCFVGRPQAASTSSREAPTVMPSS